MLTSSSMQLMGNSASMAHRLRKWSTQALCTLNELNSTQQTNAMMQKEKEKAEEVPVTKLSIMPSSQGLNCTFSYTIFFMSRQTQVSSSLRTVSLTAACQTCCSVTSESLYFSAALSTASSTLGLYFSFFSGLRSIRRLMSLTVKKVHTSARIISWIRMMPRCTFWRIVLAMVVI